MSNEGMRETWGANTSLPSLANGSSDGDEDLFRILYLQHLAGVYGLAHRMCGGKLAADIAQDVFLQLWRHPETFDPSKGSLHSLLLTMTHHKAVDSIRSESARRDRERTTDSADEYPASLDEDILRSESSDRVISALNELPEDLREAIVTAFYGNCTYKEAATVLGQPEGTIKARIRKGLAQLREVLIDAA